MSMPKKAAINQLECVMLFLANKNTGKALEQEWKISGLTFMIRIVDSGNLAWVCRYDHEGTKGEDLSYVNIVNIV